MLFSGLLAKLRSQIKDCNAENLVEILWDDTDKPVTTGRKRNNLLYKADGIYVVFIDDDDDVCDWYIQEMLAACKSNADCFGMNGWITTDGLNRIDWRISKDYENKTIKENGKSLYLRKTNHITGVKRELALKAMFTDKSNGEDKDYSEALNPFLNTEYTIKRQMYHYRFSTKNKEYV